jgi:hypothetical protein
VLSESLLQIIIDVFRGFVACSTISNRVSENVLSPSSGVMLIGFHSCSTVDSSEGQ